MPWVVLMLIQTVAAMGATGDGSGSIYGSWISDEHGLPAFAYDFDQLYDPRSPWRASGKKQRRDHFQVFGNHRVNALAVDDGYVQLMSAERGPTWLNMYNDSSHSRNLAGGFSFLRVREPNVPGNITFASAYRYAPKHSSIPGQNIRKLKLNRTFGVGYFKHELEYSGVRVQHLIMAPYGDDPVLLDRVTVTNLREQEAEVSHYEYWDVNRIQLVTQMYRSGSWGWKGDAQRYMLNANFSQHAWLEDGTLRVSTSPKPNQHVPPRDEINKIDFYPAVSTVLPCRC